MDDKKGKSDSISYKELIYFKEEIFHSLKDFEKKLLEKMNESLTQFDRKIEETKELINKYKNETNIFLTKDDFEEEKKGIITKATNKKLFDEKFSELDIRISALNKEIGEACFKYDKIFINHLTLPGIIGDRCKYKTIGDYIKNNINEMSNMANTNKKVLSDMNISKGKFENRINEFNYAIENYKQQLNHSTNLKLAELQVKLEERMILIEKDVKNILSGENLGKIRNNIDKNRNSFSDINKMNDSNKMKQELINKMNETMEKTKQMDLTVLREIEVAKSNFNIIKKSLYELAKNLITDIEINNDGFQSDRNDKYTYLLQKIKNLFEENIRKKNREKTTLPKRKAVSTLKEQKFFFEHRMKTGIFLGNKNDSLNFNSNMDISKTKDFQDDDFILGKRNFLDLKLNLLNQNENSFLRQSNIKKRSARTCGNSLLELRSPSMKTIDEHKHENEIEKEHTNNNGNNNNDNINNNNFNNKENLIMKPNLKQNDYFFEEKKGNIDNNVKISKNESSVKFSIDKNTNIKKEEVNVNNNINIIQKDTSPPKNINIVSKDVIDSSNNKIKNNNTNKKEIIDSAVVKKDVIENYDDKKKKEEINNIKDNFQNIINNNVTVKNKESKYKEGNNAKTLNTVYIDMNLNNKEKNINKPLSPNLMSIKNKKEIEKQKLNQSNPNTIRALNIMSKKEKKSEIIKNLNNKTISSLHSSSIINNINNKTNYRLISPYKIKKNVLTEPNERSNIIESIPDEHIIDIPLIPFHKSSVEIDKNKCNVEKRLIELEYFTKKKFDELVNEIKNFIPIHFNSYVKDYRIVDSTVIKKNINSRIPSAKTEFFLHSLN